MTPLRRRMIEDMRIRNLSPHTQRAYVEQVSRFARHFGRPPELLGRDEIRSWQIYLIEERRLAASSISVAVAALRFVYTVTLKKPWIVEDDIPTSRQPKKLPVVPSPGEVAQFLDAVSSPKHRMILTVCYATGLRISEAVSLKPVAIDSQRMVIRVEAGKGRKDRYVMLSPTLLKFLRTYWKEARPREWLFPGDRPEQPITAHAVEIACRQALEQSGLGKAITPHSLAPCIRRSPVGVRCRSPYHSVAVGASQPEHHVPLSAYRHQQGLRHGQSAGSLAHRDSQSGHPDTRLTA
jgi:integrase/recombinase XerD